MTQAGIEGVWAELQNADAAEIAQATRHAGIVVTLALLTYWMGWQTAMQTAVVPITIGAPPLGNVGAAVGGGLIVLGFGIDLLDIAVCRYGADGRDSTNQSHDRTHSED